MTHEVFVWQGLFVIAAVIATCVAYLILTRPKKRKCHCVHTDARVAPVHILPISLGRADVAWDEVIGGECFYAFKIECQKSADADDV